MIEISTFHMYQHKVLVYKIIYTYWLHTPLLQFIFLSNCRDQTESDRRMRGEDHTQEQKESTGDSSSHEAFALENIL